MHKTCASCGEAKSSASAFGKDKRRKDGLNPYCRECVKAKSKARYSKPEVKNAVTVRSKRWHEENREKARAASAAWRVKNLDKVRARKAAEYAANGDQIGETLRDAAYRRKYGITLAQRDELAAQAGHRCAICGRHESELNKRLAVDHDHATGAVRGLLCENCNFGLGHFRDRPDLLAGAIEYLLADDQRQACEDCQDCSVHNPRSASA